MSGSDQTREDAVRERAYFIWEREGRPEGRARDHWLAACVEERECEDELMDDEEKILAGRPDANFSRLADQGCAGWVTQIASRWGSSVQLWPPHRRAEMLWHAGEDDA